MIKMLTAHTRRADDAKTAVAEILEQLDLRNLLLKNAVGILAFHPDFLASGAVKALAEAIPFDTIGGTSAASAVGGADGETIFTVSVLTSDDVSFRAGASRPIEDDAEAPIRELYSRIAPPEMGKPSLLIAFGPVVEKVGGDDFVAAIDAASGGVPLFGSLAFTHLKDFSGIETSANGKRYADAITLVALFGEVDPRFYVTTIPESRGKDEKALITRAEKNRILRINGFVPVTYLERIGLAEKGRVGYEIILYPFVLTLKDGSQVVRAAYKVPDDGSILCYGNVPQGTRVRFSRIDADFVIESSSMTVRDVLADADSAPSRCALIVSCISRRWVLGERRVDLEMKTVANTLDASFRRQFMYSGGEICPVRDSEGRWVNRFHNFSMIVCVL
jgi:hypothetical protein